MTDATPQSCATAPANDQIGAVGAFLGFEALLLDDQRFEDWFALLAEDIVYEVPVRSILKGGQDEFTSGAFRISDRLAHIRTRIDRLATGHAWAEEPPSRVVRTVGSVLISGTSDSGTLVVESAVVLYRNRGQSEQADVIAYRRQDELRPIGPGFKLARRRVYTPDSLFKLSGLTVFL